MTKTNRSRLIVAALFAIFTTPFILAWLAYSQGLFVSSKTVNNGQLFTSPPDIAKLQLTYLNNQAATNKQFLRRWWLVTICPQYDSLCKKNLYYMRQIRQATGKNRERVGRAVVLLAPQVEIPELNKDYVGTIALHAQQSIYSDFLQHQAFKRLALTQSSLYLVDPHGNIILFYASNIAPKKILQDLERLLRVSQIG